MTVNQQPLISPILSLWILIGWGAQQLLAYVGPYGVYICTYINAHCTNTYTNTSSYTYTSESRDKLLQKGTRLTLASGYSRKLLAGVCLDDCGNDHYRMVSNVSSVSRTAPGNSDILTINTLVFTGSTKGNFDII